MRVLTIGTFDLFHRGHKNLLKRCKMLGQVSVGLNTDEFIKNFKGNYPVYEFNKRLEDLREFGISGEIYWNDSAGRDLILQVKPDILVVGSDWACKDYYKQIQMSQKELDENGILLVYLPYTEGISSTILKQKLTK